MIYKNLLLLLIKVDLIIKIALLLILLNRAMLIKLKSDFHLIEYLYIYIILYVFYNNERNFTYIIKIFRECTYIIIYIYIDTFNLIIFCILINDIIIN